jgi:hypothetical protein
MDRFGAHIRGLSVPARRDDWAGESLPTGFAIAGGSILVVVAAFVAALIPASAGAVRLGIVAAGLGVFAAVTVNPAAIVAVGVVAFLVFDGFLVNQLGELSWHGAADDQRLFVFILVSISGMLVGVAYRAVREWAVWRRRTRWLAVQSLAWPEPQTTAARAGEPGTVPDGTIWQPEAEPVAKDSL